MKINVQTSVGSVFFLLLFVITSCGQTSDDSHKEVPIDSAHRKSAFMSTTPIPANGEISSYGMNSTTLSAAELREAWQLYHEIRSSSELERVEVDKSVTAAPENMMIFQNDKGQQVHFLYQWQDKDRLLKLDDLGFVRCSELHRGKLATFFRRMRHSSNASESGIAP